MISEFFYWNLGKVSSPAHIFSCFSIDDYLVSRIDEEGNAHYESGLEGGSLSSGRDGIAPYSWGSIGNFESHLDRKFDVDGILVPAEKSDLGPFQEIISYSSEGLLRHGELVIRLVVHEEELIILPIEELGLGLGYVSFFHLLGSLEGLFEYGSGLQVLEPGPED